ncbi:hypothetical protein DOJK_02329 [Patescibacteria group bacterium]|nr:hypothetical protein DOJK_02329 [Patescibacteria group bacterium]
MKLKHIMPLTLFIMLSACSQQEENKAQTVSQTPASRLEEAKATLDASKQLEQNALKDAEQQKQAIDKATQGQ